MLYLPDGRALDAACEDDLITQITSDPLVTAQCASFLNTPACVWDSKRSVHVVQGEWAEVALSSGAQVVLGSTDATTCTIAIAVDAHSGLATVCHHDEDTSHILQEALKPLGGMHAPSLYLVGGYSDGSGTGRRVVTSLLAAYAASPTPITLRLFCVLELNTDAAGAPKAQSLAYNLAARRAFLATAWPDRGPALPARMAQLWHTISGSGGLTKIQCTPDGRWSAVLSRGALHSELQAHLLLDAVGDAELLQRCSTSPEHELPHIAEDLRASFRWMLQETGPLRVEEFVFTWQKEGSGGRWRAEECKDRI